MTLDLATFILECVGIAAIVVLAVIGYLELREIRKVLATIEQVGLDTESYSRKSRHAIKGLDAGIQKMLEAIRPDLARELRQAAHDKSAALPSHLADEERELY